MQNNNSSAFNVDSQFLNQQKSPLELESFNSLANGSFNPGSTFEYGGNTYTLSEYTIEEGDTLENISYEATGGNSVFPFIVSINGIKNPDEINTGEKILIPTQQGAYRPTFSSGVLMPYAQDEIIAPSKPAYTPEETVSTDPLTGTQVYQVGVGDTLGSIASAFKGDPSKYLEIAEYNGISNPDDIKVGQEILIPVNTDTFKHNSGVLLPYNQEEPTPTPEVIDTSEEESNPKEIQVYIVQPGDTLTGIAERFTGNPLNPHSAP